jgi:hypothetical protein
MGIPEEGYCVTFWFGEYRGQLQPIKYANEVHKSPISPSPLFQHLPSHESYSTHRESNMVLPLARWGVKLARL